jgi:hypothetical protein
MDEPKGIPGEDIPLMYTEEELEGTMRPRQYGTAPIAIDWNMVADMVSFHMSGVEISECLGIEPQTLYARCWEEHTMRWSTWIVPHRLKYAYAIRKKLWEKALEGNERMLALVARKFFGFKDETEFSGKVRHEHIHVHLSEADKTKKIEELRARLLPQEIVGDDNTPLVPRNR